MRIHCFQLLAFLAISLFTGNIVGQAVKPQFEEALPTLTAQLGHSGSVTSISFSPNEEYVLTSGVTSVLWDRKSGREIRRFIGENAVFARDSQFVATSIRNTIKVWNTLTGEEVTSYDLPMHPTGGSWLSEVTYPIVSALTFSANGTEIIAGAQNGEIHKINISNKLNARGRSLANKQDLIQYVGSKGVISNLVLSADGKRLLSATKKNNGIFSSGDNIVRLWDVATGVLITALPALPHSINSIAFSLNETQVLVGIGETDFFGSADGTARLFDLATGKEIRKYEAPRQFEKRFLDFSRQAIYCVAFSPDGKYVVAAVDDDTIRIWDAESAKQLQFFTGFKSVRRLSVSRDTKTLLTAEMDSFGRITDLSSGSEIQRFEGKAATTTYAAFTSNGRYIVTAALWKNYSPYYLARVWDVRTGREVRQLPINELQSISLSPDARYALTKTREFGTDGNLSVWDLDSGRLKKEFRAGSAYSIAVSPNGQQVVVGGYGNAAELLDLESGKSVRVFAASLDQANSIVISPGGRYVAIKSFDNKTRLTDLATGSMNVIDEAVERAQFSPDGKLLMTLAFGIVQIFNTETAKEIQRVKDEFLAAAFSPSGKIFVTGGQSTSLWDVATGKKVGELKVRVPDVIEFSADGTRILTLSIALDSDVGVVQIWDSSSLNETLHLEVPIDKYARGRYAGVLPDGKHFFTAERGHLVHRDINTGKVVKDISSYDSWSSFSPDGRYGLSVSYSSIVLKDLSTNKDLKDFAKSSATFSADSRQLITVSPTKLVQTWDLATLSEIKQTKLEDNLKGTDSRYHIRSVDFSPDGKHVLTASSENLAKIWNVETGAIERQLKLEEGAKTIYSPDGRYVLVAGKNTELWEIGKSEPLWSVKETGTGGIAISADGNYILTGDERNEVQLRNFKTGQKIRSFVGHTEPITSVAFSPDGKFVLTSSNDGTARLWNTNTGRELCRLIDFKDGNSAVVEASGRFDTSDFERARGILWVMPDDPLNALPIDIYTRDFYEPRLLPRLLAGETFPEKKLAKLNRAQPVVEIKKVEQQASDPSLVNVTVEVAESEYKPNARLVQAATKSGIYDLRLFRDGQLVDYEPKSSAAIEAYSRLGKQASFTDELKVWREMTKFQPDAKTGNSRTFTVKLPKNKDLTDVEFSAYAFNTDRVKSLTNIVKYKLPAPLKAATKGKAYLVTIGVAANEDPYWNLFYPVNDGRRIQKDLYEVLSKRFDTVVRVPLVSDYGGITKKFGECVEKTPSKQAIKSTLQLLAGKKLETGVELVPCANQILKANPEDMVVIFFSGHGFGDSDGNYYLLPYNMGQPAPGAEKLSPEALNRTISSEELSAWMRDIDAGDMLLILDACQSAAVTGKEFKPGPMGSRGLGQLAYDKGMRMIVATQADNQALGSGPLAHGLLTYALTKEGLEGDNQPSTVKLWLERAAERVPVLFEEKAPESVKKLGKPQQPSVYDFARNRETLLFGSN